MAYLENSSTTGNLQNYINTFMNECNDAVRKINELKMATPETIQLMVSIYNSSNNSSESMSTSSTLTQQPSTNPFQSSSASNIFGGSTQLQAPSAMNTASIFGASATAAVNNPFQPSSTSNIFGGNGTSQQQTTSAMSGASMQPQSSMFSNPLGQTTNNLPTQSSSMFGQSSSSIFGGTQQPPPPQTVPSASIFAQPTSSNVFSQNPFGISAPLQTQPTTSIFGGSIQPQPLASAAPPPAQSIFGAFNQSLSLPSQTSSIFGGSHQQNPFQSVQSQEMLQQPSTNIFATAQSIQPITTNIFTGQTTAMTASSQMMAPSQNIFGIQQPEQLAQPLPQQSSSIFQIQQSAPTPTQSFGGNPFQQPQIINDDTFYSKPEELTNEDNEAYQTDNFVLGKIPLNPPSKSYCF